MSDLQGTSSNNATIASVATAPWPARHPHELAVFRGLIAAALARRFVAAENTECTAAMDLYFGVADRTPRSVACKGRSGADPERFVI